MRRLDGLGDLYPTRNFGSLNQVFPKGMSLLHERALKISFHSFAPEFALLTWQMRKDAFAHKASQGELLNIGPKYNNIMQARAKCYRKLKPSIC
jgi:hypothetical protein